MSEFFTAIAPYTNIILAVVQLAFAGFIVLMKNKFATRDEFNQLKEDNESLSDRQSQIEIKTSYMEKSMAQLPTAEAIHNLSIQLTVFEGKIENVNTRFENVSKLSDRLQYQVDRMEDFLKRRGQ